MVDSAERVAETNAVLVLDVDPMVTRVVLCDVVEGAARLIDIAEVPTTSGPPFFETSVGVSQAIRKLEDATGRRIIEGDRIISPVGQDGDGVDAAFVTGMPVEPIRVGVMTMGSGELDFILKSAIRRAAATVYDAGDYLRWSGISFTPAALEGWLRDARPDSLLLIDQGGSLEDWRASLDVIAAAVPEIGVTQGIIVGDDDHQQVAADVLDEALELSGIDPAEYDSNEIASAVEVEVRDQYANSLHREPALKPFSSATFLDRIQSTENVTAFLHRRMRRNLAVVLNQTGTLIEVGTSEGALSVFRADLDISNHARSLIQIPSAEIARWLPFQFTEDEIRHWLLNRSLRPGSLIEGDNDRAIAAGAVRAMLLQIGRHAGMEDDPDIDLIVTGRELIDALGHQGPMVIVDALQPLPADGVVMLSVDRDNVMSALGSISAVAPDYAREVIENDFLAPLASWVVFSGSADQGETVAQIEIVTDDGASDSITLNYGEIHRFPMAEGRTANVTVSPSSGFSVGRYAAGESIEYNEDRVIHGGKYGIIFDGRGRPATLPEETDARIDILNNWNRVLGNDAG